MPELVHTFAGNPLDRGEPLRRSEEQISALESHDDTLFLPFHKLNVGTNDQGLVWLDQSEIGSHEVGQKIFLGTHDGIAHFAVDMLEESLSFTDCRAVAASVSVEETGIIAQARAQLDWHYRNPYCAQCGGKSNPERGGQIRRCGECQKHIFPRTDPVAIMLIVDKPGGERCLLGRPQGRFANTNFFTALAGFLDQGESLEDAVRREVWEEAGIRVGDVQYHSSQPWPFPSQLMIGCHGVAETTDINFDEIEMADVQWFDREEALAAVEERNDDIRVPGKLAIAHHLIDSWATGKVNI